MYQIHLYANISTPIYKIDFVNQNTILLCKNNQASLYKINYHQIELF
jgi:hypothetical protein